MTFLPKNNSGDDDDVDALLNKNHYCGTPLLPSMTSLTLMVLEVLTPLAACTSTLRTQWLTLYTLCVVSQINFLTMKIKLFISNINLDTCNQQCHHHVYKSRNFKYTLFIEIHPYIFIVKHSNVGVFISCMF